MDPTPSVPRRSGTGTLVTNSNGNVRKLRHFEPFGGMVWESNVAGHWPEPQFAGHLAEGNLGLYDFRARHYDPDAGQFLQVDPFVPDPYEPADLNPYGYVRNDPVNLTDPTGTNPFGFGFLVAAIVHVVLKLSKDAIDDLKPQHTPPPAIGWVGVAQAHLELAPPHERSVATRTGLGPVDLTAGTMGFLSNRDYVEQANYRAWVRPLVEGLARLAKKGVRAILERRRAAEEIGKGSRRGDAARAGAQAARSSINVSERGLAHVAARHTVGGAQTAGKSVFSAGEDVVGLVRKAEPVAPVQQAGGNFQRVVDAGRTIGIDRATGQPTSIYTVITDAADNLITAFPGVP